MLNKRGAKFGVSVILLLVLAFSLFYSNFVSAPTTRLQELITLSDSAIDVGIYTNQGVKLDWSENGPLHRCLEINISRTINSSNLSLLLKETNLNTNTEVKNIKLEKYTNQSYQEDIYNTVCNPYDITNPNSSITTIQNCSQVFAGTETKYKDIWNSANLIASESQTDARFDSFNHLGTGKYRYCFDVPIKQNGNGFGNKGTVYLELDNNLYVNKQGSSWWNNSYIYKACLNISNPDNDTMLSNFTVNFTINTSALKAAGKLNDDCSDLRIIYNNITELDRVLGNNTWMESSNNCSDTTETIWFKTQENIPAKSENSTAYCIYYGNPNSGSAPEDPRKVFLIYDDFNRPNSTTVGNGWATVFGGTDGISAGINASALTAQKDNQAIQYNFSGTDIYLPEWELKFAGAQFINNDGYITFNLHNASFITPEGAGGWDGSENVSYRIIECDQLCHGLINKNSTGVKLPSSPTIIKEQTILKKFNFQYNDLTLKHIDDEFYLYNESIIIWNVTDIKDNTNRNFNGLYVFFNRGNDRVNHITFTRAQANATIVKLGPEQQINVPPTQTKPLLTATSILNSTTDNLTCYNQSTQDINNDPVTNIYNWYKNSQPLSVLNMPFESSSKDYSGKNNNGTINGPIFIQGKIGNSLSFDGIDDYVSIPDANSLDITNAVTIESWIKLNSSTQSMILDKNLAYRLWFPDSSGKFQLSLYINGIWNNIISNTALTVNTWYHITVTYNSSTVNLYINGIEDKSQSITGLITQSTEEITIGSYKYGNYFFNGTIDEIRIYPYSLTKEQVKQRYDETKDGLTANSTIAAEETIPGESYFCQVTPNDGAIDGITLNSSEIKILWKITFNVTSGEDGSQLVNFNINCTNSFTKTGANSPYPVGFLPGSYECNLTKGTFYDKVIAFTVDSDKIINVTMSVSKSLTIEEHNQLQAIYECLINGNCEAYNLWKNTNKTTTEIWKRVFRTDRAVITQENIINSTLSNTSNITINYMIQIPFKQGYSQGELLPLRMFFWFHNGTTCYNQDKTTSNRAETPYCFPLTAETLGPNNGTLTFTVELRPNLPSGTYNITRTIEIDPIFEGQRTWINYGQEGIGIINVLQENGEPFISLKDVLQKYNEKKLSSFVNALSLPTGNMIKEAAKQLFTSNQILILIGMILSSITIIFVSYFKYVKGK